MKSRQIAPFVVLSCAALLAGAAVAQPTASELRAQRAQLVLSERYAQVYASLPSDQRRQFASDERRWLNGGRWDELRDCLQARQARHDVQDEHDAAALCLAEAIERRVRGLAPTRVVANR
jgi:hypothetical protein